MNRTFYQGNALDKELRALYEEGGKLPDMKHLNHKRERRVRRILLTLTLFFAALSAASWAGFLLFGSQGSGSGEVELRFDAEQEVKSATPQKVVIRYRNLDRQPLASSSLRLRLPPTVAVREVQPQPQNSERLEWEFGTLAAREDGKIELTVVPYGLAEEKLDIIAILGYKPANFNAEFQTSKTHTFTIRESAVAITLKGATQASAGQTLAFTAKIRNLTEETLGNIRVSLEKPSQMELKDAPSAPEGATWIFDTLEPQGDREINFSGTLLSGSEEILEIVMRAETKDGALILPLGSVKHAVQTAPSDLNLQIIANETPDLRWIRAGENLNVRVEAQNRRSEPIEKARIILRAQGDLIDFERSLADEGAIDRKAGSIQFPRSDAFAIAANSSQNAIARLATRQERRDLTSPFITLAAEIAYEDQVIQTPPYQIIVVSDLSVLAGASYFDPTGKAIGQGPLPPRVGEETRFRLRLRLKNSLHDLSDIVAVATLPEKAEWAGNSELSGGRIEWNAEMREVRWNIPRMPVSVKEHLAQFDVAVAPTPEDRGGLLPLLGITRVEALDTIAQVRFSADAPLVSSALDADPFGKGKGVVE